MPPTTHSPPPRCSPPRYPCPPPQPQLQREALRPPQPQLQRVALRRARGRRAWGSPTTAAQTAAPARAANSRGAGSQTGTKTRNPRPRARCCSNGRHHTPGSGRGCKGWGGGGVNIQRRVSTRCVHEARSLCPRARTLGFKALLCCGRRGGRGALQRARCAALHNAAQHTLIGEGKGRTRARKQTRTASNHHT